MSALGFVFVVASFAVLCLLPVVGAREKKNGVGQLTRERRDDDVTLQSLLTSVQQQEAVNQQQAAVIQRQESALQAIGAQVAQLQTSVTALQTQVFFTAHVSISSVTMSTTSPLRFDSVSNNVGSGYNAATGVFRAPEAGTYVFYAQLMMKNHLPSLDWVIVQHGAVLCKSRLEESVTLDTSSCLATTALHKGQEVFVRSNNGARVIDESGRCSFSGFRLP